MTNKLITHIQQYVCNVIAGFESGIYKMISQTNPERIILLKSKHHPFITIFRDLHEKYYTSTFNSIVSRDDKYVTATFDAFAKESTHSKQCLLNVLANLIVSVHFNLSRRNLDVANYNSYMKTLQTEILETLSVIEIKKLFDHVCTGVKDNELVPIPPGQKFIKIDLTTKENGVVKELKSFTE